MYPAARRQLEVAIHRKHALGSRVSLVARAYRKLWTFKWPNVDPRPHGGSVDMASVAEPPTIPPLTERLAWKNLEAHYRKARALHLRDLFASDPPRGHRLTAEA